ncbi:MAG: type II secretion system protein [Betaproteobacteria bacterium]
MASGSVALRQQGYTYIALLIAVALIGVGLAAASEVWSQSRQREKEQELLFVGEQFRQAIGLYYERTPGAVKRYPEKLQDLLEDKRHLPPQRHLRKVYADPMTGKPDWALVAAPGGGLMGVHSRSEVMPVKSANFAEAHATFKGALRYSRWQFIYQPIQSPSLPTAPAPAREVR